MENKEKEDDSVLAFDTLFTTNSIQILKIILPCIPAKIQRHLAVYIKYLELQYTIQYFKIHPVSFGGRLLENQTQDIQSILPKLQGYLSPAGKSQLEQLMGMLQTFKTIQEMKSMMDMMNAFSDNNDSASGLGDFFNASAGSDPMEFLKGMLTPEQQAMFDMFSADT
ncbi:MAG: hypothetical protein J6B10_03620 [Lachnospiraceae bacterium]|nr:hypothetical protein [Lachnospiraceae bacterium]